MNNSEEIYEKMTLVEHRRRFPGEAVRQSKGRLTVKEKAQELLDEERYEDLLVFLMCNTRGSDD